MDPETLSLLVDLHINNERQGPGSLAATLQALTLTRIDRAAPLAIADIGCGTGAATLPLLTHTQAHVTAVELLPAFLESLKTKVAAAGFSERLTTVEADMQALPFRAGQFDVLWSEGAIYNMGFANGVAAWRPFLKPHGVLVVSEITWLRPDVPTPLKAYWDNEYPKVATAVEKIAILEQAGYSPLGYFPLPSECWLEHYYDPLRASFPAFLERHHHSEAAKGIVAAEETEIALYEQYQEYVSYGMYIAQKVT